MSVVLPNPLTLALGQGVQLAYQAYTQGNQWQPSAPPGWQYVTSVTGWDTVISTRGVAELFGLVFQDVAAPSQYMIAFRGTDSDTDMLDNLFYFTETFTPYQSGATTGAEVSRGFNGIYIHTGETLPTSMQASLFGLLESYASSASGLSQLYVTGHSLGGALAELFALDLALSLPQLAVQTITFAAPMVGIGSWVDAYDSGGPPGSTTIRVVNTLDVVPALPPSSVAPNYGQVAQQFSIEFKATNAGYDEKENIIIRHEMDNYLYVLTQAITQSPQQWAGTFPDAIYKLSDGASVTDQSWIPGSEAAEQASEQPVPERAG